jgi:hypothetical protein
VFVCNAVSISFCSPCNSYYLSCTLAARADLFIGRAQVLIPHSGRRCVVTSEAFVSLAPSARARPVCEQLLQLRRRNGCITHRCSAFVPFRCVCTAGDIDSALAASMHIESTRLGGKTLFVYHMHSAGRLGIIFLVAALCCCF